MDLYPEDNSLSGIDNCVFEDHDTDADHTFAKETSGFTDHPSQTMLDQHDLATPLLLLERMGISDSEDARLSGRMFMASALRNLMSSDIPDLVLFFLIFFSYYQFKSSERDPM
jgi:hypothetical protein